MRLARYVLPALMALGLLAPAVPALADSTVVTKGGTLTAHEYYPTYTALVVITPDFRMKVIPTDQVVSIDGVPYAQAYWGTSNLQSDTIGNLGAGASPTAPNAARGATASGAASSRVLGLASGTRLVYDVQQVRSTWLRHGLTMAKRPDETLKGTKTSLVSASGTAGLSLTENTTYGPAAKATPPTTLTLDLAPRGGGVYLQSMTNDDARLRPAHQVSHLAVPALLWPNDLSVGKTWVVGPYQGFGQSTVMRMQVVGQETVTVPAGTYPDAYKVVGYGHVCGGTFYTDKGRLANQVGVIEQQVWIAPGLGVVKQVQRLHLHQDYFPNQPKGAEQPLVLEIQQTDALREFSLGKQ
ncbi:MAG TPA: hypothetical protein V6D47_07570 [Oscillatoriaceae cyanobacterium]